MFCLLRDRCVFVFVSYMLTFSLLLLGAVGRSRPSVSLTQMNCGSLVPQGSTTQEALGTNTWSLLSRFGVSAQRLLAPMLTMRNERSENWMQHFLKIWMVLACAKGAMILQCCWWLSGGQGLLHSEFDLWIWIELLPRISNCSLSLNIRK